MQILTKEEFQSLIEGMTINAKINIMPKSIQHHGGIEFELYGIHDIHSFAYIGRFRSGTPVELVKFALQQSEEKMLLRLFEHNYLSEYKIKW